MCFANITTSASIVMTSNYSEVPVGDLLIPADVYGYTYYSPLVILISSLGIMCILGNSLTLSILIRFPVLRDSFALAIGTLSVADCGFAVSLMLSLIYTKHWTHSMPTCQMSFFLTVYFGHLSTTLLGYMSVDRAVAIWAPITYSKKISTKTRVVILAVVAVAYFIADIFLVVIDIEKFWKARVPCGPSAFQPAIYTVLVTGHLLLSLAITIIANIFLFVGIRRQGKALAKSDDAAKKAFEREKQIAATAMTVVGVYLATYLPYIGLGFYVSQQDPATNENFRELLMVLNFSYFLLLLNSSLNPMIYALKNKKYRNAMKALLGCERRHANKVGIMTETTYPGLSTIR